MNRRCLPRRADNQKGCRYGEKVFTFLQHTLKYEVHNLTLRGQTKIMLLLLGVTKADHWSAYLLSAGVPWDP